MWTHHNFFSLFSVKGHLRCFQFWIMMNKAMVKTHIQVFVGTHVAGMDCVINTYAQLPHCVSAWLYHFASPPACVRVPHSHQHFAIVRLKKILALLKSVLWYPVVVLIYISLIINNIDHLFLCVYLPLYIFFSEVSFKSFAFLFELGSFCIIKVWEFLSTPDMSPYADMCFVNICSQSEVCLLVFLTVSVKEWKFLVLKKSSSPFFP